jgi:hypothetical protein
MRLRGERSISLHFENLQPGLLGMRAKWSDGGQKDTGEDKNSPQNHRPRRSCDAQGENEV